MRSPGASDGTQVSWFPVLSSLSQPINYHMIYAGFWPGQHSVVKPLHENQVGSSQVTPVLHRPPSSIDLTCHVSEIIWL